MLEWLNDHEDDDDKPGKEEGTESGHEDGKVLADEGAHKMSVREMVRRLDRIRDNPHGIELSLEGPWPHTTLLSTTDPHDAAAEADEERKATE